MNYDELYKLMAKSRQVEVNRYAQEMATNFIHFAMSQADPQWREKSDKVDVEAIRPVIEEYLKTGYAPDDFVRDIHIDAEAEYIIPEDDPDAADQLNRAFRLAVLCEWDSRLAEKQLKEFYAAERTKFAESYVRLMRMNSDAAYFSKGSLYKQGTPSGDIAAKAEFIRRARDTLENGSATDWDQDMVIDAEEQGIIQPDNENDAENLIEMFKDALKKEADILEDDSTLNTTSITGD